MTATEYAHVKVDERDVPYLEGTTIKLIEVILDHVAWGLDADQIHKQHPHLSIASIHSALAYYYDHKSEMEAEIRGQLGRVEAFFASRPESATQVKLKGIRGSSLSAGGQ